MVVIDTIEGFIGDKISFHYDVGNDVLYVDLIKEREAEAYGDEDDDGFINHRRADDDRLLGLTIVSWWKRFGSGELPDSLAAITMAIEPMTKKLMA